MSDAMQAMKDRLPGLFARGIELLRDKAAGGDAAAQSRLDDASAAESAVRLVIEGQGELWIAVRGGELTADETRPEGVPVRLAVAVPADAVDAAFGRVPEGAADDDAAALRVAGSASSRAEKVIEGQRLDFHIVLEGVPDVDRVAIRVSVGSDEPPETPRFTATVSYDDLEDARERKVDPTQFLMGGRVRFAGDYVPALQLGMQLAQAMQPPRLR